MEVYRSGNVADLHRKRARAPRGIRLHATGSARRKSPPVAFPIIAPTAASSSSWSAPCRNGSASVRRSCSKYVEPSVVLVEGRKAARPWGWGGVPPYSFVAAEKRSAEPFLGQGRRIDLPWWTRPGGSARQSWGARRHHQLAEHCCSTARRGRDDNARSAAASARASRSRCARKRSPSRGDCAR